MVCSIPFFFKERHRIADENWLHGAESFVKGSSASQETPAFDNHKVNYGDHNLSLSEGWRYPLHADTKQDRQ